MSTKFVMKESINIIRSEMVHVTESIPWERVLEWIDQPDSDSLANESFF